MNIEKRIVAYNSEEYIKTVELRNKILRKPLGLVFTEDYLVQDEHEYILALFKDGRVLATLNLQPVSETVLKMRQVAVDNEIQGKGLGKKLVEFSEQFALEKGYQEFILHARKNAVPFYKHLQYKILDPNWFTEVGIPHLKMGKVLR